MSDATRRALRTFLQALIALIPTIPGAAAVFDISAESCAKVAAIGTVLVTVVTFIVNWLEDNTTFPAVMKAQASSGLNPVTNDPQMEAGHMDVHLGVLLLIIVVVSLLTTLAVISVWNIPHS